MEGGGRRGFQQVVKSGKAVLGQGTDLSKGTEAGKCRAQLENGASGGSTGEGRTLQWAEVQEALNLALNPHWLWILGL